jgi:hemerythrin-like domain-containing protein
MMERNSMQAKRIIEDEHRSLAAVLHGMLYVIREIRYLGTQPDFVLLEAMVHYIDAFQERFHHPKEDAYLFKLLGSRYLGAVPLLDRLKQEHESGAIKLRELQRALTRYRDGGSAEFPAFAALVAGYATFHWGHMRLEENDLLPLAERHLTNADWDAIDTAFLGHTDPLLGTEQGDEYKELFRRIVNLAPAPIGVAPVR